MITSQPYVQTESQEIPAPATAVFLADTDVTQETSTSHLTDGFPMPLMRMKRYHHDHWPYHHHHDPYHIHEVVYHHEPHHVHEVRYYPRPPPLEEVHHHHYEDDHHHLEFHEHWVCFWCKTYKVFDFRNYPKGVLHWRFNVLGNTRNVKQ